MDTSKRDVGASNEWLLRLLMRGKHTTEQIYSAGQLWWFPVAMLIALGYVIVKNGYAEASVVAVEGLAIIVAASLSSFNYAKTIERIAAWATNAGDEEARRVDSMAVVTEKSFRIINMAAFIFAVVTIYRPTIHLFAVLCVYVLFCLNNTVQGFTVVRHYPREQLVKAESSVRRDRAIELRKWLSEENGPAIIAYTAILVLFCALEHVPDAVLGFRGPIARDAVLRGLAAGAAGFHLTVSTFKYRNWQHVSADLYALNASGHEQQTDLLLNDADDRRWMNRIFGLVSLSAVLLVCDYALHQYYRL